MALLHGGRNAGNNKKELCKNSVLEAPSELLRAQCCAEQSVLLLSAKELLIANAEGSRVCQLPQLCDTTEQHVLPHV